MYAPPITGVEKTPQINAVVASVVKDFSPAVKYIRYDIRGVGPVSRLYTSASCSRMTLA